MYINSKKIVLITLQNNLSYLQNCNYHKLIINIEYLLLIYIYINNEYS